MSELNKIASMILSKVPAGSVTEGLALQMREYARKHASCSEVYIAAIEDHILTAVDEHRAAAARMEVRDA